MKVNGKLLIAGEDPIEKDDIVSFWKRCGADPEYDGDRDSSYVAHNGVRFRVNLHRHLGKLGAVLRQINTEIPDLESLGLPVDILTRWVMAPAGIILITGPTGSGKSTTLASSLEWLNQNSAKHIVTIEDPIEYLFESKQSLFTQREVHTDTDSFARGLRSSLRQAPDVILIGEIRNPTVMSYAIQYAETGHLVFATLHANNANQAIDRIIHFFESERHTQTFMDLSLNLKGIVAQQLIPTVDGEGRRAAIEILLNSQLVSDYIRKGEIHEIKNVMTRSRDSGMQTFDQALFDLYENGEIEYQEAIKHADSPNDLRLQIKLNSKKNKRSFTDNSESLSLNNS